MADTRTVRIGCFIPNKCQLLDLAAIDVFGTMSHEYISEVTTMLSPGVVPASLIATTPNIEIHYIGMVTAGGHIQLTSNQTIVATDHYADPAVGPGKLDIVMIPGPDPNSVIEKEALDWLAAQAKRDDVDILSICTGIFVCGQAGLLQGKKTVCGPKDMQEMLKERFGDHIIQKGSELRWVQDGNFWSSGGVTNGNDLVAAYARQSKHFPRPIVELALNIVEVGDRGQYYPKDMGEKNLHA